MTKPATKRFQPPAIDKLPEDIRTRILAVQEKSGFVPNVFLTLAYRPDEFRAFFAYHDALMEKDSGLTKAEREMIVVATSRRQPVPLLRDRAWRDPAHPGQEPADRRPDRRQLPQGRHHAAAARHARLRHEGEPGGRHGFGGRFCRDCRPRLFSDDDIWDITAIAAFFALSNRLANVTAMRPNDEFYMMGRLPKQG